MPVMISPDIYAAQRGYGILKWVNAKTATGSAQVLTDATLYYDLSAGEVVLITCMCYDLVSLNDNCLFELVSCTAVAGGGTPTSISGQVHIHVPAAQAEDASQERRFTPPIRVRYADGVRSISMKINANDSSAVINCGWQGYRDVSL